MPKTKIALFCLALCGCDSSPTAQRPVLSWDAYGPVRFGMTVQEAEKTAGPTTTPFTSKREPRCDWVSFASLPEVLFMVESDILTRAETKPGVLNSLGIEHGMSIEEAQKRAPQLRVTPHKYDPNGHYLRLESPDRKRAIVMETKGDKIDEIRAGLEPSVSYVEGCS